MIRKQINFDENMMEDSLEYIELSRGQISDFGQLCRLALGFYLNNDPLDLKKE